jgi:hypothetical protein
MSCEEYAAAPLLPPPTTDRLPLSALDWDVTRHARARADERGFDLLELYATVCLPEQVLPDGRADINIYYRGDCKVVANSRDKKIVTVASRNTDHGRQSISEHNEGRAAAQRGRAVT